MLCRRSRHGTAERAVKAASGLIFLERPNNQSVEPVPPQLALYGAEQPPAEAHALKRRRNIEFKNLAYRPRPSAAGAPPTRIALRHAIKNEKGGVRAALDLALPPERAPAGDHALEMKMGNYALISGPPGSIVNCRHRLGIRRHRCSEADNLRCHGPSLHLPLAVGERLRASPDLLPRAERQA